MQCCFDLLLTFFKCFVLLGPVPVRFFLPLSAPSSSSNDQSPRIPPFSVSSPSFPLTLSPSHACLFLVKLAPRILPPVPQSPVNSSWVRPLVLSLVLYS